MAQTITKSIAPGSYPSDGVVAAWLAENASAHSQFASTGKELLLARNVSVDTEHTLVISSVADEQGRTGDITDAIPFGEIHAYGPFPKNGWVDASGYIQIAGNSADIEFMVIQLP